eukprot:6216663-Ditylum_brightwellii.AAC.1
MEESSATVLMAEMNDSTNGGAMLRNNYIHDKNEEDNNEEDIYLLGCEDLATFESKLDTHFITYFEQQDVDTRLCGLHSLNNASSKRGFNMGILRNI